VVELVLHQLRQIDIGTMTWAFSWTEPRQTTKGGGIGP
jgi:hypothetical protein